MGLLVLWLVLDPLSDMLRVIPRIGGFMRRSPMGRDCVRAVHILAPKSGVGYKVVDKDGRDLWGKTFKVGESVKGSASNFSYLAWACTDLVHGISKPYRYLEVSFRPEDVIDDKLSDNPYFSITQALKVEREIAKDEWSKLTTGMVILRGCKRHYKDGLLNDPAPDSPAVINPGKCEGHFKDGVVHRDKGPAIIYASGWTSYYTFGKFIKGEDKVEYVAHLKEIPAKSIEK
ncbi:MAG: hypothetical protein Hyperionvirus1_84 [Hyperionvirus sp.]|uniref:Uncharacterized protein n=1 Tax=Hyperionvirus sp. TaxID=2487770 RepID=A0A3G5A5H9_9VIRU|nr:MAG: hypothetical protein Hyperionvirus1_84 [Hyperionvirus sp.]